MSFVHLIARAEKHPTVLAQFVEQTRRRSQLLMFRNIYSYVLRKTRTLRDFSNLMGATDPDGLTAASCWMATRAGLLRYLTPEDFLAE